MKIFLQQIINKISPCLPIRTPQQIDCADANNNLSILTRLSNPIISQPSPIESLTSTLKSDFFLNNKLGTYENMLDNFINHHGTASNRVEELILEEQDIADRIYNIHTITGNNNNPFLLRSLKEMYSIQPNLMSVAAQESDISSITPSCGHSLFNVSDSSATVELSPLGEILDITSLQDIVSCASTSFGG